MEPGIFERLDWSLLGDGVEDLLDWLNPADSIDRSRRTAASSRCTSPLISDRQWFPPSKDHYGCKSHGDTIQTNPQTTLNHKSKSKPLVLEYFLANECARGGGYHEFQL